MNDLHRVQLIGHLGHVPEVRYLDNGTALTTFNIATNHSYTAGEERQTETEWRRCAAGGKLGEHPYPDPWAQGDSVVVLKRLFPKRPSNVFALDQAYLCQCQAENDVDDSRQASIGHAHRPMSDTGACILGPRKTRPPLRALVRLAEWSRRGG